MPQPAQPTARPGDSVGVPATAISQGPEFVSYDQFPNLLAAAIQRSARGPQGGSVVMSFNGAPLIDPQPLADQLDAAGYPVEMFLGRANSFRTQCGRHTGMGHLLMLKGDFDRFAVRAHRPENFLRLGAQSVTKPLQPGTVGGLDGWQAPASRPSPVAVIEQARLCVLQARAIAGSIDPTIGQLSQQSVLLLTVGDARAHAAQVICREAFNLRYPSDELGRNTERLPPSKSASATESKPRAFTWAEIVVGLWERLKPIFLEDINLHPSVKTDLAPPDNVTWAGHSVWEALWAVLDTVGWTLTIDPSGKPFVYDPRVPDADKVWPVAIQLHLLDSAAEQIRQPVPERVVVVAPAEDYQWWQRKDDALTNAQDAWREKPIYVREFTTAELSGEETASTRAVIAAAAQPGTEMVVWAPWIATREPDGKWRDQEAFDKSLRELALLRWKQAWAGSEWLDIEIAGTWAIRPGQGCDAVEWADIGDGARTRIWSSPFELPPDFDPDRRLWQQQWTPRSERQWDIESTRPTDRWFFGTISGRGIDPEAPSSASGASSSAEVAADGWASVYVLSGRISAPNVQWEQRQKVNAANGTGRTLAAGQRVYVRWDYQLRRWAIVAATGSGGGGSAVVTCAPWPTDTNQQEDSWGGPEAAINRRGMLRARSYGFQGNYRTFLEVAPGPRQATLQSVSQFDGTDPDAQPERNQLRWTRTPAFSGLSVMQDLLFGFDDRRPNYTPAWSTGVGAALLTPKPAINALGYPGPWSHLYGRYNVQAKPLRARLPYSNPGRSHRFLIAGPTNSKGTALDWFGPGLSGSVTVKMCASGSADTCFPMHFENGLLVGVGSIISPATGYASVQNPASVFSSDDYALAQAHSYSPCQSEDTATPAPLDPDAPPENPHGYNSWRRPE